ncbi:lipopolysaccharide assembly protein LapB [Brevundimonas sp. SORGH_AS_0993]|uniref:tetratricopeptide repeat protein n=1 Tax=Brevundimonas sp. SORGH_AS_0993 TaxID=3041794 RepID=UPI002788C85F|nr:tetratricopeptide repeat protein [Brevundimonas sp. SORGH_AS_0993]MDQ1154781.1 tetratricopeptide (TPR) repeat protein [Brevundimonas sp. SORGH_AS_0993]
MKLDVAFRRIADARSSAERKRILQDAKVAKSQHDWRGAADLYRRALVLRDGFGPRVQLGHMLKEAGELDAAEAAYFEALKQRPDDADLNVQIGHFFWVKGDAEKSLHYYERAAQLAPNDGAIAETLRVGAARAADAPWQGRVDAAMAAMAQGRWAAAETDLQELVDAGRRNYLLLLAHAVKEQGRLKDAVALYSEYLQYVTPEVGARAYEARLQYANALQLAQRFSEAAQQFSTARMLRMETEGWAGSEDHILEQIRICIRQVHPALDTSRLR